jgi:hypothetical protein
MRLYTDVKFVFFPISIFSFLIGNPGHARGSQSRCFLNLDPFRIRGNQAYPDASHFRLYQHPRLYIPYGWAALDRPLLHSCMRTHN